MNNVWFCIPSARPAEQVRPVVEAWRKQGYKVALWREEFMDSPNADLTHCCSVYPGYANAVNFLAMQVIERGAQWIITGGDDTYPDPNHTADEIAAQCENYFGMVHSPAFDSKLEPYIKCKPSTFGVMQPTGDRFAHGCIDRIAGSPWMGREWCLRANQGKGPLWPEFKHMFVDEALKRTAEKLGVYWPRPDLIHLHKHFQRESDAIDARAIARPTPEHMKQWSTPKHWQESEAIFKRLKAEGFASCMPL